MKSLTILVPLCFALVQDYAFASDLAKPSPLPVVQSVFQHRLATGSIYPDQFNRLEKWLTPQLLASCRTYQRALSQDKTHKERVPALHSDPLTGAQEQLGTHFTVQSKGGSGDVAHLSVRLFYPDGSFFASRNVWLTYSSSRGWLISNIERLRQTCDRGPYPAY
ncbi:hypothetical protein [Pseudomonas sp. NA-150]|uniref:hypothetical protein n=1 Tax=Pseudomonas sp. NA-150 TaxID=3367525 RepID=UPI0037C8C008